MDDYLDLLSNAISEKEFITDYHQFYPVGSDLEELSKICPELYPQYNINTLVSNNFILLIYKT